MIGKTNVGGGGVRGIDFGEVTLASAVESVTVSHNLGAVPSWVALIPKTISNFTIANTYLSFNSNLVVSKPYGTSPNKTQIYISSCENTLTKNEITFNGNDTYPWYATDYYWFAIA